MRRPVRKPRLVQRLSAWQAAYAATLEELGRGLDRPLLAVHDIPLRIAAAQVAAQLVLGIETEEP